MSYGSSRGYGILGFYILLSTTLVTIAFWLIASDALQSNSFVKVKGLAEKTVQANYGVWHLSAEYSSNYLSVVSKTVENQTKIIQDFLIAQGVNEKEIRINPSNTRINNFKEITAKYTVNFSITVETDDIQKLEQVSRKASSLLGKGIALRNDRWTDGPFYYYKDLNKIKKTMIATATKNALLSAKQFAKNSGATVGKIKQANQGVFQILPINRSSDNELFYSKKVVRVVSTLQYFLD